VQTSEKALFTRWGCRSEVTASQPASSLNQTEPIKVIAERMLKAKHISLPVRLKEA